MIFTDYLFEGSKDIWEDYIEHPFLIELGEGSLDKEKFKNYLIQDYLYLKEYAKVFCMAVVKSKTLKEMRTFYEAVNGIINDETATHITYLKNFGIDIETIENNEYHMINESYTSYMKGIAMTGDICEIAATILPCTWSYSYIGQKLEAKYNDSLHSNFFKPWIDTYSCDGYTEFTNLWINFTNELCKDLNDCEKERLKTIFRKSSLYEMDFWNMAYKGANK
ncbi:MAG: thiaminase II [Romboutsia sp.]|uniref:thiaminase II n=1 Tax=Romboutsia sp. TaxID=1965302 RepID=UPI003F326525